MRVCIRRCLATVVSVVVICLSQVNASDEKTTIPRISVAVPAESRSGELAVHGAPQHGGTGHSAAQDVLSVPRISVAVSTESKQSPAQSDRSGTTDNTAQRAGNAAVRITEIVRPVAASTQHQAPVAAVNDPAPQTHVSGSDDRSAIPHISVAVSAESQHSALDTASQGSDGTAPARGTAQSGETRGSANRSTAANSAHGPISPAISDQSQSVTSGQPATNAWDNKASTARLSGPVITAQPSGASAHKSVPQINAVAPTITEIIKPVAASTKTTPNEEPATTPQTTERYKDEAGATKKAEDMTKPGAGSSAETLAAEVEPAPKQAVPTSTTTVAEGQNLINRQVVVPQIDAVKEVIKPVDGTSAETRSVEAAPRGASPVTSAGPGAVRGSMSEETKGEAPGLLVPQVAGNPPLTTVIMPMQAIIAEKGEISSLKENTFSKNLLETDDKTKSPTNNKKPNSYTITPNEFAKKTAVVHAQQFKEESIKLAAKIADQVSAENSKHKETELPKEANLNSKTGPEATPAGGQASSSNKSVSENSSIKADDATNNKANENEKSNTNVELNDKPLKSSYQKENINLISVQELAKNIINEFKYFGEELTKKWKERKEKVSWLGNAFNVLQNYKEKITETEKYSTCPIGDRKKYEAKIDQMNSIIKRCESTLKRKDWQLLQEKTNETVNQILSVLNDYNAQINQISKEDGHFNARKLVIEENTKRKLLKLNTESFKNELAKLKESALKVDEEDYKKCLEEKETKAKGSDIVSDTMTAIMQIYACV